MKSILLNVPDNQAEHFAIKLAELVKNCGGSIGVGTNEECLHDENIPIWERVKTVEDAMALTGMELPDNIETLPIDVQAFLKLRVICAAYNGLTEDTLDQFPKFEKEEYRYYPWFVFYTQEEIDEMGDEDKARVLGRSNGNANAYAGVACSYTSYDASYSNADYGGRLCFKTRELSAECGKRFLKLWAQYIGFITEDFA